jgi:cytochrome P450
MPDGSIFYDPRKYEDLDRWHATAAAIRAESPVLRVEPPGLPPFWAVLKHAHVVEVERQPDRFWNTKYVVLDPSGGVERLRASGADLKTLVHMDGEEHRGYRAVTNEWFKPQNLRRLFETRINELSRAFVDRMAALGGECDFATEVALYYPLRVIMSILGVPEKDEPLMLKLTQGVFGAEDPELGGPDAQATMAQALADLASYFQAVTLDRRARPTEDLASTIANGTIDGEPVGDMQTISYYAIVATAGHDTTSSSLAGGLEALIRHPDQLRDLQQDPRLIDNAVDEIIRWVTPVRHFMRYAQEDYVLGGTPIRAGERVLLSYLSANHDEEVFPSPFSFDIRRANANDHLAFGIGVHFCLGAHLARMELRAFLRELLPRLESIELMAAPTYASTTFVGGPKHVPIRYKLRRAV